MATTATAEANVNSNQSFHVAKCIHRYPYCHVGRLRAVGVWVLFLTNRSERQIKSREGGDMLRRFQGALSAFLIHLTSRITTLSVGIKQIITSPLLLFCFTSSETLDMGKSFWNAAQFLHSGFRRSNVGQPVDLYVTQSITLVQLRIIWL